MGKKSQTVKTKIEKPKLETIDLKHHDFELIPEEISKENPSNINLTQPIKSFSVRKGKMEAKSASIKIDDEVKTKDDSIESDIIDSNIQGVHLNNTEDSGLPKNIRNDSDTTVSVNINKEVGELDSITKNKETEIENEHLQIEKNLKKVKTVKTKIESPKLETVDLKQPDLELNPEDISKKNPSSIVLTQPIKSSDVKELKKVRKNKKEGQPAPIKSDNLVNIKDESSESAVDDCNIEGTGLDKTEDGGLPDDIRNDSDTTVLVNINQDVGEPDSSLKDKETEIETEHLKVMKKLKKTKVMKTEIEDPKPETIALKHHAFELIP